MQTVTRQTMDDQQAITLNQAIVGNVMLARRQSPMNCTLSKIS
ncbi:MAG: hypothetical protein U1E25_08355 [Methylocystis sp.]